MWQSGLEGDVGPLNGATSDPAAGSGQSAVGPARRRSNGSYQEENYIMPPVAQPLAIPEQDYALFATMGIGTWAEVLEEQRNR